MLAKGKVFGGAMLRLPAPSVSQEFLCRTFGAVRWTCGRHMVNDETWEVWGCQSMKALDARMQNLNLIIIVIENHWNFDIEMWDAWILANRMVRGVKNRCGLESQTIEQGSWGAGVGPEVKERTLLVWCQNSVEVQNEMVAVWLKNSDWNQTVLRGWAGGCHWLE